MGASDRAAASGTRHVLRLPVEASSRRDIWGARSPSGSLLIGSDLGRPSSMKARDRQANLRAGCSSRAAHPVKTRPV